MSQLTRVSAAGIAAAVAMLAACSRDEAARTESRAGALAVAAAHRGDVRIIGSDTLSDSARITRLVPEPDGDAVGIVFSDPARQVRAGLALVDRAHPSPQLLWPDSVTAVWWSGPHSIAFSTTTGAGVRAVVDVHKATVLVTQRTGDTTSRPASGGQDVKALQRAAAYVDSVYVQPGGRPQSSALKYQVDRLIPSREDSLAAFYVTARDSAGRAMNPAWYALDLRSGRVERIEQITGSILELPSDAAGWGGQGRFFYAKGRSVWEADVARRSSG